MKRIIYPEGGQGTVEIPSSKSDVHRILIAAALATEPTQIVIRGMSKDIEATMECLKSLGSEILKVGDCQWKITPIWNSVGKEPQLSCGESGSTFRFLLPVAAAVVSRFSVSGEGRLPERPITELMEQMEKKGCAFTKEKLPFAVEGKLKGGRYLLPGNISSQYITGLLLALPLLGEDSEIVLSTKLESKAYVKMTLETLRQFKIEIKETDTGYFIPGKQQYQSPGYIEAEGDWSNAAFFLSLGAIKGPVSCVGLKKDTFQGDSAIIKILKDFGADIVIEDSIIVKGGTLKGIEIDASEIPDLVPVLSVVAATAEGTTRIYNAERLRIKESDRLAAMCDGLQRAGVQIEETQDGLLIEGKPKPYDTREVSGYNDHRIVMAMSVAAIGLQRNITIEGTEAIEKSYPRFYEDWEQIGGETNVI